MDMNPNLLDSRCPYCRKGMTLSGPRQMTRDHIRPRSKGANLSGYNKVLVCAKCNNDKGDSHIGNWQVTLAAQNDPRAVHVANFIEYLRTVVPATTFAHLLGLGDLPTSPDSAKSPYPCRE